MPLSWPASIPLHRTSFRYAEVSNAAGSLLFFVSPAPA